MIDQYKTLLDSRVLSKWRILIRIRLYTSSLSLSDTVHWDFRSNKLSVFLSARPMILAGPFSWILVMPLLCCCSIKTASSCLRFISLNYGAISPIAIPSFFFLKFVRLSAHFSSIRAAKPGIKNVISSCPPSSTTTREQNNSIEEATQVEEDRVSMDSGDPGRRWTSLKERLGFKGMGCCGSRRRPTSSSFSTLETLQENPHTAPPLSSGMNLAMALAAERNSREEKDEGPATEVKTLMRLIEETDGVDWRKKRRRDNKGADTDWLCCVCMERSKGAAFIPCGHTFCRVCSREMWVNRGTCPLCNRSILETLDIF